MGLRVEVLSGARRGLRRLFEGPRVTVGRHPDCDLQLDPEEDRVVSARHAALWRSEDRWFVRDLDSRNGTFVDGERVEGRRRLPDGAVVHCGPDGPRIRVERVVPDTRPVERAEPGRRLVGLGRGLAALGLVAGALAALAGAYLLTADGEEAGDGGPENPAVDRAEVRPAEEGTPPSPSRGEGGAGALPADPRPLDSAAGGLRPTGAAADLDVGEIESRHWRALARVYVETSGGDVVTATAFSVRSDGLLVTSRHVVLEADGRPAARIGVQFARSDQVWPGELVATTDSADLALLRARNVVGDVPAISELGGRSDSLAPGSPVAVMGYSGEVGGGRPESPSARLSRPGIAGGLLVERRPDRLLIRGPGGEGGSGSPVFGPDGHLVGVVRGGLEARGGKREKGVLVAVPSSLVRGLLEVVLERLGR